MTLILDFLGRNVKIAISEESLQISIQCMANHSFVISGGDRHFWVL